MNLNPVGWPTSGLRLVARLFNSGVNSMVPVTAISEAPIGVANTDIALIAKGTGATLAQVPDGTATGGNKRGTYATDLQKSRSGASQVASGSYSAILGGDSNQASSSYSFVGGGIANSAAGSYSFVGSGGSNIASGDFSVVVGGRRGTTRSIIGYHVFAACSNPIADAHGVTQSALLLLARETTSATATVLTSDVALGNPSNQVILPNNAAYFFKGSIIAGVTGGGNTAAWEFKGAIKRGAAAASTAIVGTTVLDRVAYDTGAASWTVTITADTTNGGIAVTVTGAAATTIRWVCKIETTEMTY